MRYRTVRTAWLIVLVASVCGAAHAQQTAALPADKLEKIEKAISAQMSKLGIPGLSVAVVVDHKLRWSNGYGLADVENFVPAKSMTAYRLGSISKPITAAAVMELAERGKLDLDAPIQKYCPAFPAKQWPVTARLLLGHLSGVRHYKVKRNSRALVTTTALSKDSICSRTMRCCSSRGPNIHTRLTVLRCWVARLREHRE